MRILNQLNFTEVKILFWANYCYNAKVFVNIHQILKILFLFFICFISGLEVSKYSQKDVSKFHFKFHFASGFFAKIDYVYLNFVHLGFRKSLRESLIEDIALSF